MANTCGTCLSFIARRYGTNAWCRDRLVDEFGRFPQVTGDKPACEKYQHSEIKAAKLTGKGA